MPQRISTDERRARLGRRHRLAPSARAADPVAAADAVVCLHGTDAASVYVSAWARMEAGTVPALERALYEDRSLLRVLAMRRTMFVAPVDTASVLLAACSRDVAVRERKKALEFIVSGGHGGADVDAWLTEAEEAALAALVRDGEATAPELAAAHPSLAARVVVAPGTNYEATQSVVSRVLTVLGAEGRAIRTRPRGSWTSTQFRWAALAAWQPAARVDLDVEAARAELAARWLRAFGPATVEDLKWWTGWPLGVTRAAVAAAGAVAVDLADGVAGLALPDDLEPEAPPEPWVALLPALDPTTMGWKQREWYLGDLGPQLFDRNGNAGPTVWADGRIVGAWAPGPDGAVRCAVVEDVGAETRAAIDAEAEALTVRLDGARLAPRARGRSPLEQTLVA